MKYPEIFEYSLSEYVKFSLTFSNGTNIQKPDYTNLLKMSESEFNKYFEIEEEVLPY